MWDARLQMRRQTSITKNILLQCSLQFSINYNVLHRLHLHIIHCLMEFMELIWMILCHHLNHDIYEMPQRHHIVQAAGEKQSSKQQGPFPYDWPESEQLKIFSYSFVWKYDYAFVRKYVWKNWMMVLWNQWNKLSPQYLSWFLRRTYKVAFCALFSNCFHLWPQEIVISELLSWAPYSHQLPSNNGLE